MECRANASLVHEQASVERGFSINKQLGVVNLQERAYVAQRIICDHIHSVGGLLNVVISKHCWPPPLGKTGIPNRPRSKESTESRQRSVSSDFKEFFMLICLHTVVISDFNQICYRRNQGAELSRKLEVEVDSRKGILF